MRVPWLWLGWVMVLCVCVLQEQSLLQPPTLQLLNGMGPLGRRASDGGANIQLHAQQLLKRPRGPSPLVTMTPVSSTGEAECLKISPPAGRGGCAQVTAGPTLRGGARSLLALVGFAALSWKEQVGLCIPLWNCALFNGCFCPLLIQWEKLKCPSQAFRRVLTPWVHLNQ